MNSRDIKDRLKQAYYAVADEIRLLASAFDDTSGCKTVGICLGPYRNLTTLTGSVLFLHPNVQVLNHAGRRVFGHRRVDFLEGYSKEKLRRFVQLAIRMSKHGERAAWGGSIIHSHAFDESHNLKGVFEKADFGRVKSEIECLFWKESLRVSKHIRQSQETVENIVGASEHVQFLMPIRNPMDCAKSNMKTGHHLLLPGVDAHSGKAEVLEAVMSEISWYAGLKKKHPDRFFHFFEHDLSGPMLQKLAGFLELEQNSEWVHRSLSVMDSKSNYNHSDEYEALYADCLEHLSFPNENVRQGLHRFLRE